MYWLKSGTFRAVAILAMVTLAGCGVDGEPIQPTRNAGLGVPTNVKASAHSGAGLHQGPISLYYGF